MEVVYIAPKSESKTTVGSSCEEVEGSGNKDDSLRPAGIREIRSVVGEREIGGLEGDGVGISDGELEVVEELIDEVPVERVSARKA